MNCPCCSENLLRHISRNRLYWFCPNCRQEMPGLSDRLLDRSPQIRWIESTPLSEFPIL